jgi:hypothetical protein
VLLSERLGAGWGPAAPLGAVRLSYEENPVEFHGVLV